MRLIGLAGLKTSGKDTACGFVQEALYNKKVTRVAFADKLKLAAAKAIGLKGTDEQMIAWMNECKDKWEFLVLEPVAESVEGTDVPLIHSEPVTAFKGREYLQWFGTEAGRQVFGDEFWVDLVLPSPDLAPCPNDTNKDGDCGKLYCPHCGSEAGLFKVKEMYPDTDVLVITDARFENEARRIKALGGEMWEIIRPGLKGDGHASEQKLDSEFIDYTILNNGTLEDLRHKVKATLYCHV